MGRPTPLVRLRSGAADRAGVGLYLKRDDLIHPQISGNKWRKLKYNLLEAHRQGHGTLLTFGGAYSNHLYAVAAAGREFGFDTVGLVRGEETRPLSPTLAFARSCGMTLAYVPRERYRHKTDARWLDSLRERYGDFYLLPEGGSNALAVRGVAEGVREIDLPWTHLCCPCGTGGTLAGLVAGAAGRGEVIGFSALKGGGFLRQEAGQLLCAYEALTGEPVTIHANWQVQTDYHFGGYARVQPPLLEFIRRFEGENGIPIEQVYTAKMLWGIEDQLNGGCFARGAAVVALHTGGLQGRLPELGQNV
ncbi:MAG: 1-aminocyclopropane-1-carboxylate deaminase/D-cysteine desulfhydrase [Cytophagales bacterium]|nr:1-aminocyclopropane-1-carboxylate deaminase/D-cysteine desulfhydrase [Cytophagales bacterium]